MKTKRIINVEGALSDSGRSAVTIVSGLVGAVLLVTGAQAADAITSKVDVTQASKQFTGAEWRSISLSASRVLMHVDNALDALANKKTDDATGNIEKGMTLVKLLDGVLPSTTVKTEITGGGITYTAEDQVKPAFAPIYREYDSVDVISPVAEQKQQPKPADKNATPKAAFAPEVSYAGLDYSGVKLDLRLARRDLLAAQDSIKAGDAAAAKLALQDIQSSGVIFEFSTARLPLARAMDNLRLAESELKNNHPDQAKAALAAATDALKNYETIAGDSRAKEVQKLEKEIGEVTKNLNHQTPETFSQKVSEMWDKCLAWFS